MDSTASPYALTLAAAGVGAGLWLLGRGMRGYRTASTIADTGTSTIASMAAGDVRISGGIEPAEVLLLSPLQSLRCVYYRAVIRRSSTGVDRSADFEEERAVGFIVRDTTGAVRVFPRGARWDAPIRFDASTGSFDGMPTGLAIREGAATVAALPDRETAIAELLSPRPISRHLPSPAGGRPDGTSRRYEEARLEPGDIVTIVGRALPFSDMSDPAEADLASGSSLAWDDPEVAADIAAARAQGILAAAPEDAWGNAGIPGFGIGEPVRTPELDPGATRLQLADADDAARAERIFRIAPDALVLASAPGTALLIVHGLPGEAANRQRDRLVLGLLGAVLAIVSAMVLALLVSGAFRT